MKVLSLLSLMVTTLTLSSAAFAVDQPNVSLPSSLKCKEVICVYGSFCRGDKAGATFSLNTSSDQIQQSKGSDQVIVDLGDGDQTETYTFQKDEVSLLNKGTLKSVRALHNSGFWWSDGDHTNALTVVECSL